MVSLSLKYHCNINHQYRGNFQWGNEHHYKPGGGGVFPYISHIGKCRPIG